jgi:hypothetical protein
MNFFSFFNLFSFFSFIIGSVDGVIKRWDLSGEGKKKETEIVKKGGEKMDNFEEILKEPTSEKMKKPQEEIVKIPKRRFLDFYFEDAILAEENRIKLSQNGKDKSINCYLL